MALRHDGAFAYANSTILNGMMTLRHDDMMERSPLPPQAGNTRLSYNDRGAYWESSGRRNEKMMIGGRANSMSPPLGVSNKNGGGLSPRHTNVSLSAPGSYSKAISTSMLSGAKRIAFSATFSNTFCNLSRLPRRSFTMLPDLCSTHPAFSGTSRLA